MQRIYKYINEKGSTFRAGAARIDAKQMAGGFPMRFDTSLLQWTRPPRSFSISPEEIRITTEPGTDLWQRTYYGFQNDNAPVLQMET